MKSTKYSNLDDNSLSGDEIPYYEKEETNSLSVVPNSNNNDDDEEETKRSNSKRKKVKKAMKSMKKAMSFDDVDTLQRKGKKTARQEEKQRKLRGDSKFRSSEPTKQSKSRSIKPTTLSSSDHMVKNLDERATAKWLESGVKTSGTAAIQRQGSAGEKKWLELDLDNGGTKVKSLSQSAHREGTNGGILSRPALLRRASSDGQLNVDCKRSSSDFPAGRHNNNTRRRGRRNSMNNSENSRATTTTGTLSSDQAETTSKDSRVSRTRNRRRSLSPVRTHSPSRMSTNRSSVARPLSPGPNSRRRNTGGSTLRMPSGGESQSHSPSRMRRNTGGSTLRLPSGGESPNSSNKRNTSESTTSCLMPPSGSNTAASTSTTTTGGALATVSAKALEAAAAAANAAALATSLIPQANGGELGPKDLAKIFAIVSEAGQAAADAVAASNELAKTCGAAAQQQQKPPMIESDDSSDNSEYTTTVDMTDDDDSSSSAPSGEGLVKKAGSNKTTTNTSNKVPRPFLLRRSTSEGALDNRTSSYWRQNDPLIQDFLLNGDKKEEEEEEEVEEEDVAPRASFRTEILNSLRASPNLSRKINSSDDSSCVSQLSEGQGRRGGLTRDTAKRRVRESTRESKYTSSAIRKGSYKNIMMGGDSMTWDT